MAGKNHTCQDRIPKEQETETRGKYEFTYQVYYCLCGKRLSREQISKKEI